MDDSSCEVSWEALLPMKGDPVAYALQFMMGNSDFKQVCARSSAHPDIRLARRRVAHYAKKAAVSFDVWPKRVSKGIK